MECFPAKMDYYVCGICEKQFVKKHSLRVHINQTHGERKFACEVCKMQFKTKYSLRRHINVIHRTKIEGGHCGKPSLFEKQNECAGCSEKFCSKTKLQLLTNQSYNEGSFVCIVCSKQFKTRKLIQQHIKNVHLEKTFECNVCRKKFSRRWQLQRHLANKLNKEYHRDLSHLGKQNECSKCNKIFSRKWELLRHLTRNCDKKRNRNVLIPEKQNECAVCGEQFRTRMKLQLHINRTHNADNFICAVCSKQFKTRKSIQHHIRNIHYEKKFECSQCSDKFHRKWELFRHLRDSCNKKSEKHHRHSLKCGFCNSYFLTKKKILQHFQTDHEITLIWELLQFNSEDDFKQFKLNYQCKTITQFVIRDSHKKLNETTILYKCHRSGLSECKKKTVKFPKMNGLKKIQSYCPAEMRVKYFENGKCVVNFQKIHLGHDICDQNDLAFIHLDTDEREEITAKIELELPKNHIYMKPLLAYEEVEAGNKLQLLTNPDLQNVTLSYDIQNELKFAFSDDLINIDDFVDMNATSVLFIKKQSEEDVKFNVLAINDFALILMSKFQEKNLRHYGKNIIAFDETHGTNHYDFILHTMLVMDINCQGIPAAFLISNRNDEIIINIFFQCIKEKVGVFIPRVIMSDMQLTYKNSWVNIMQNEPNFTLWCTWHVREAWRKNYGKIFDTKKRNAVKKTTMDLAYELDPALFQIKLTKFLSNNDTSLTEFISYFRREFVENEKSLKWAYCYRREAGINTNMSVEAFHKTFNHIHESGKSLNWLNYILNCIQKYLDIKGISEELASYVAVRKKKLNKLRVKHHEARKMKDVIDKVHVIDSNSWLVESFEEKNTTYFIEKREIKECSLYEDVICRLYCDFCKICFHEYSCNCLDAAIQNNMCKHIHAIGIAQQNTCETHIPDQLVENHSIISTITEQTILVTNSSNESSHKLEQIEETARFQENEIANVNALEKDKQDMRNFFDEILEKIHNRQVLTEIRKRFLKPINAFSTRTPK